MNFTVNRLEFLAAAQDAERVISASSPLDVLKGTYLEASGEKLLVAATNLEIALERHIPANIQEEGSVLLPAKLLSGMLRLLDAETVSISQCDGIARIQGGSAEYTVSPLDKTNWPHAAIPFPEDTAPLTGIPDIARRTVFAVSEEDSRPVMKCVHLIFTSEGLQAVSSDGFRIAAAKGDRKSTGSTDILLPASSLEKLAELVTNKDELRVGTTGKAVVFMKDDFLFSARLIQGDYFDAEQIMSKVRSCFTVLTDSVTLCGTVKSACIPQSGQKRFSIAFQGNRIRVTQAGEQGRSETEMEIVPLSGTPAGEFWYNPEKLLECLKALSGTLMLEVAANGILVMRTDELVCMQMPLRQPPSGMPNTSAKPGPGEEKTRPAIAKSIKQTAVPEAA